MSSTVLCAVILLASTLTFSAAQSSCRGRCGAEYYRGYMCQCDYNCLLYGECCKDFEAKCTTKNSCKGRCGETFKRGRLCSCDADCIKYKQCCADYEAHCDAEEPTLNEATEQTSTYSEENNADDHSIPLISPTSYPQDDLSDDELSNNGVGDPKTSPIPESTSGDGLSIADLLDPFPNKPKQDPDTLESSTDITEITKDNNNPSTLSPTIGEALTESTDANDPASSSDAGTTLPQPTTAVDHVSSQPASTSVPQTGNSPTANTPEIDIITEAQSKDDIFPEAQNTDPSDKPEVITTDAVTSVSTGPTQGSSTVLENTEVTTISASTTLHPTPTPTISNPKPDDTEIKAEDVTTQPLTPDLKDPSISVSPAGNLSEPDALTTHIPTSTKPVQDDVTPGVTTTDPPNVTTDPTKPTTSEATSKPQDLKPKPYKPPPAEPTAAKPTAAKPSSKPEPYKPLPSEPAVAKPKPETKPLYTEQTLNREEPRDFQADDNSDTNLCSGRPVSAVTTLRNGTIVVFRGHYFWFLDRNRVPGPAREITQVWGIPSPIDTVFTRCNCQGKTYIFKGGQFWRFENDVLDTGYPKVVQTGFAGLRGHITAALSVPQYQNRRESVYFFKRGGLVQKYSYQLGTSPTCSRKPQFSISTVRHRIARQAVSPLGPTINIQTSWRGFPSMITAAVSVPSNREPEGYKYYVFSRSKSYNVRMDAEHPVIAAPAANTTPQSNSFFKCPKKV
ncbi:proteoglycan 4b isoform X2 [Larimichthys crocea]|uniref:proteoglycan 4b isoform X2 n=1 Tax=Larimichthys crocea TaxID=215358 RepID=UPI000F5FAB4C|nr:proteoglycan 4 isoform X2 [Larimichthys crocea]